jgi:uncharacterized protein (DUF2147 family)
MIDNVMVVRPSRVRRLPVRSILPEPAMSFASRTAIRRLATLSVLPLLLGATGVQAQSTPVGLWKTIDDETKAEKSLVRIVAGADGALVGKVEKILDPQARPDARCDKCEDERKDQPILGMTILRKAKAADGQVWEGGDILDPNKGKVYRLRLKPLDGGARLEVRGYLGPFYRNQIWQRVE